MMSVISDAYLGKSVPSGAVFKTNIPIGGNILDKRQEDAFYQEGFVIIEELGAANFGHKVYNALAVSMVALQDEKTYPHHIHRTYIRENQIASFLRSPGRFNWSCGDFENLSLEELSEEELKGFNLHFSRDN